MSRRPTVAPFFETPPAGGARRLLLVSFHFPPDTNVGALRWEKMLQLAAKQGWSADVLLTDIAGISDSQAIDRSRLNNLPPGTRLFGVPLPRQLLVALLRFRQRFVRPSRRQAAIATELSGESDPSSNDRWHPTVQRVKRDLLARSHYRQWRRWAGRAARYGIALAQTTKYECVISSGPPHMAHEAARRIAAETGIPLITDFRDPWTSDDVTPSDLDGEAWRALSNRYERMALEASALIVSNTPSAARFTKAKYPDLAGKVITTMNGADADPQSATGPSTRFTITYAGSLYGGRYPQPLLRAVRRLVERRELKSEDLVVHFIGVEDSQREPLLQMAAQEGLESFFICETRRPRYEAMALLDRSSVLVLLPQVHIHSIPAKLFEYVQRPVWVLVLSEPGTAVAELLEGTAAEVVPPTDVDAIAEGLGRHFDEFRAGRKPIPLNADGRFSRERQAEVFFSELERVIQRPTRDDRAMPETSPV
jgi:glycosyltransferase involved in cell wall biosynthesis